MFHIASMPDRETEFNRAVIKPGPDTTLVTRSPGPFYPLVSLRFTGELPRECHRDAPASRLLSYSVFFSFFLTSSSLASHFSLVSRALSRGKRAFTRAAHTSLPPFPFPARWWNYTRGPDVEKPTYLTRAQRRPRGEGRRSKGRHYYPAASLHSR